MLTIQSLVNRVYGFLSCGPAAFYFSPLLAGRAVSIFGKFAVWREIPKIWRGMTRIIPSFVSMVACQQNRVRLEAIALRADEQQDGRYCFPFGRGHRHMPALCNVDPIYPTAQSTSGKHPITTTIATAARTARTADVGSAWKIPGGCLRELRPNTSSKRSGGR
jgi:hypothetical protein